MEGRYRGYAGETLLIDLGSRQVSTYPWTDLERELYLGGKIMAAKIMHDIVDPEVEPFSPENPLVVTTGPLTGSGAPSSSRFNISTLSPLTNLLTSSNCGGNFGFHLKKAGFDGVIITGKSPEPVWIEIDDGKVVFHDAGELWGKTTGETQEALPKNAGKMVIGPAGENLVLYASIVSQERVAGRAGVEAVMGSKNLKAVTARGSRRMVLYDEEKAKEIFKEWVKALRGHPLTGVQLPQLGSAGLVAPMQYNKILATRNFARGRFDEFEAVSGETLREKHLIRNKGCITCPIQCGRVVEVDGKEVKGPELETLGLLGPNLENSNLELILEWNYLLDELGMDTISAGSTVGFAMELNEKGLWDNGLAFGEVDNLADVFRQIACREGIGDLLADGTKRLSERFGGREFAIHSKGLELSAYEPRRSVGMGLGYATSNRGGCHLNGGYLVLLEGLALNIDPLTTNSKAALTILFQNIMEAVSAGGSCLFTCYLAMPAFMLEDANAWTTRWINRALTRHGHLMGAVAKMPGWMMPFHFPGLWHTQALTAVTGMKMTFGRFKEIGERGYNLERMFNAKRGVTAADDALPKRLTDDLQDPEVPGSRVPLDDLKKEYYKLRGWDFNGLPKKEKLRKLGLAGVD
jgi:aldehyde:ferredoxin oxidoreductase